MKNVKRIASVLLVIVMALSLFVGCGKTKLAGEIGDGKIKVGVPGNVTIPDMNTNGLSVYMEKATGLDITWDEFANGAANYTQQITLMYTGGEKLPDVMVGFDGMGHYTVNQFGEDGIFVDLSELIADGKAPNYEKALKQTSEATQKFVKEKGTNTVDGKSFYSLPSITVPAIDDQQSMVQINKKWLENVGMEVPTNIKELTAVCKAFMEKDANGNGDPSDEIPMLDPKDNPELRDWIINAFVEYNSANFNVKKGKVWDPITSDEFRQAIKCINDFTKKGYYNELSYTASVTEVKNQISPVDGTAGRVGIFGGHMESMTNASTDVLDDYIAIGPLADETGKGGYNIINDVIVSWDGQITSSCEDLDEAIAFLDAWYVDECVTTQRWGVKGEDWVDAEGKDWFGNDAHIKVINQQAFFDGSQNKTFGNTLGIMTEYNYYAIASKEGDGSSNRQVQVSRLVAEQWAIRQDSKAKRQEDTLESMVYTTEEYDYRESKNGLCDAYIKENVILFMQGEKDINSDKEWTAFKDQLKKLERPQLMKTIQDAYNRKVGK